MDRSLQNPQWRARIFVTRRSFVDCIDFLFIERASLDAANVAVYSPAARISFSDSSEEIYTAYHAFIRKFAHFFVYAVLAFGLGEL
jgi:hypothetical protein